MSYQDYTLEELKTLWKQKRNDIAQKDTHDCLKEMGELYKLRREIERRLGESNPIVNVNFENYITD